MKQVRWTALLAVTLLSACGGSSSSSLSTIISYTVGGTITGLAASGLVLLDNGGDSLTVTPNATSFQFATVLNTGSAYSITVHTQPTGGTCVVSNGSGTITANVNASVSCTVSLPNVVAVTVTPGPAAPADQTFNIPLTSVTVCIPSTATCATINNVLIDTGSSGLRILASVLAANGVTLPQMADPSGNGNTIHECLPFAQGYSWGTVASAEVNIGGESAASIPVQVIDDSATPSPAAPETCTSYGTSDNNVNAFDANGVLGVGVSIQDCGAACDQAVPPDVYYSCTAGGSCSPTSQSLADQVANPVASFSTDDNGVLLQLSAVPLTGAASASGYLVFGIGTQSNNGLNGATVLTADAQGNFTTMFDGQSLSDSFIDSGSNALYFPDGSIPLCGQTAPADEFYCPNSTLELSATNVGANGNSTAGVGPFAVVNLNDINPSYFAVPGAAGPAAPINYISNYFDWGLPFFYNNTVFIAIEGSTTGSTYGAYAY